MSAPSRRLPVWAWLLITPLALFALAWAALAILFPPAKLRALLSEQLNASLTREVRFADAGLTLWPPVRLSVTRPELAEPGGFANGAAFRAEHVGLDLDVFALLSKHIRVKQLVIDQPALHLVLRADGTTNFDGLVKAQRAPANGANAPALDVDLQRFKIDGGRVLIDDLRAGKRTALELETDLALATERSGQRIATHGTTELTGLAWGPLSAARESDLQSGLAKLVLHLEHQGVYDVPSQRLALETLTLSLGHAKLGLTGRVDSLESHPLYDLRARGDGVDLAEVLAWAAVADAPAVKGIAGRGKLAFDIAAQGAAAATAPPRLRGWLTLQDAAFRYSGAPAEVNALALRAEFAPDSVTLRDVRATVAGQPLTARLRAVRLSDPLVDFALAGDLDLAAVGPLVPGGTQGAKLGGHARVDVQGRGRANDPGTLALDGRAELRGVSVEKADLPSRVHDVNGTVAFANTSAEVRGLSAQAGKSSFTLDGRVTRPMALMADPAKVAPAGVTFDFRSPYLDLAELLPTTPGAPFLPNAQGGGKVRIERLKQGKLDVSAVTADVKLEPARLEAPSFAVQGYGGSITGKASFDLRDTRKPVYSIQTKVDKVQANDLLSAWTPAKNLLQGTLSTDLTFSGAGSEPADVSRTLTLVGLAALNEGQLGPGPTLAALSEFVKVPALKEVRFKDLKLPLRIESGRVITDGVNLSGSAGDWKLAGAVGFDGALDYAVSVTLPPEAVAALNARSALAAGALSDDKGRMLLDLRVTGSAKSPHVAWDTRAMRDRLAGRASAALTEQSAKVAADAKAAAAQAIAGKLGLASSDSTRRVPDAQAVKDSLKKAAGGLLDGFFGRKKSAPAPAPASAPSPAPAPAPAPADTTKH